MGCSGLYYKTIYSRGCRGDGAKWRSVRYILEAEAELGEYCGGAKINFLPSLQVLLVGKIIKLTGDRLTGEKCPNLYIYGGSVRI